MEKIWASATSKDDRGPVVTGPTATTAGTQDVGANVVASQSTKQEPS